jgi:hypothetical protein
MTEKYLTWITSKYKARRYLTRKHTKIPEKSPTSLKHGRPKLPQVFPKKKTTTKAERAT